jgi:tetratricopeptide (TPR) repeat protein
MKGAPTKAREGGDLRTKDAAERLDTASLDRCLICGAPSDERCSFCSPDPRGDNSRASVTDHGALAIYESLANERIGDVLLAAGEREAAHNRKVALDAYHKSLVIAERLADADPGNTKWQRDLLVLHNRIGDVLLAADQRKAALGAYYKSLLIAEGSEWARDAGTIRFKIHQIEKAERSFHQIIKEIPDTIPHITVGKIYDSDHTVETPPSKPAVIQPSSMGEPSEDIERLAGHLPEGARAPFKQRVSEDFEAAATIAERGTAAGLSAIQIAIAIADETLVDRLVRFQKGLREIELPEGGFATKEQAQAAAAFAKTFHDLQESEAAFGLPLTDKPHEVSQAEAMKSEYYRYHTETGEPIPRRPRGRPRRTSQPQAGSQP